ncbi:uncharacterized protein Z518_11101 [Rhinocladiella mackenziei CBS 650.93]|uniref:Gfo/Idh/MocA-like oxidoreductase N-terminal domain-containing protein n=1 Tax=Rhinocladiella mackenziei CBS 650.93 TaxID=1442369 RepID=A0A0D2I1R6_9EURO|nr:uncharacterized protein Z518_11101 [Rhinocladiella mackenziei CBS 650.93]KIW99688.1 hypothetical protein Z518_11101 [Rhinocladiella mackenziei CBS 650.93]
MGKKLNIAVAGLGRMRKRHVLTLSTRVARANVVAVCSTWEPELEWARDAYKDTNITLYDSYDAMVEHPGLEAVWISSRANVHAQQTLKAIQKRLHVLCEKPLSTDIEEAEHVVSVAEARPDLKVMAGYSRRFDASPFMVRSTTCDLIDNTGFFVKYAALNGGMFVDAAIHDIDLSLYFMGEDLVPKSCFAIGTIAHHPELRDLQDVDNGVGAHGHDVATEIVGTEGKMSINLVPAVDKVVYANKSGWGHKVEPEYWERFTDAFALEANEFVDCILDEKPTPVGLDIGLKGLKIGWALQESLLTGTVVKFDEKFNRICQAAEGMGKFKTPLVGPKQ